MSLKLGKSFNRKYTIQIPIMNGYYNLDIYFDKKSTFLLFNIKSDFENNALEHNVKINMFKNLEASKFCETFIDLHNFRKNTLDIVNQFKKIKDNYTHNISFILNETITLSKLHLDDKNIYDKLTIYGLTMEGFNKEFVFIITERQNILKRLGKKIVRTSALQIATTQTLDILEDYHQESKIYSQKQKLLYTNPNKIIDFGKEELENIQHI